VRAYLLDIEGTTTPVTFVYDLLFPYAREHVAGFLERHGAEDAVRADLARLQEEQAADVAQGLAPPEGPVAYVHWLMDRDRKSTGLKSLQGKIWEEGYRSGALRGDVYPDVPTAFERWHGQGCEIAIFSSGSVLAQRLLFGSTRAGDLTPFIRGFFDTTTGPKAVEASYRSIAKALGLAPADVLFVSDTVAELDAARDAGMRTALCVRDAGPQSQPAHPVVHSFDEIRS
jgi:enolase-phosphatase E1